MILRPIFSLSLMVLVAGGPCLAATSIDIRQQDVTLYGTDGSPPIVHSFTSWGSVIVDYVGEAEPLYFNLNVDGVWRVVNMPLLALQGVGNMAQVVTSFGLGNNPGDPVSLVSFGYSISSSVSLSIPSLVGDTSVSRRSVSGGDSFTETGRPAPDLPAPGDPPAPGGEGNAVADSGEHEDFKNQQCGPAWCVPAAISDSLRFLLKKDATDADTSQASLAAAFGQTPGKGIGKVFIQKKKDYVKSKGWQIQTFEVEGNRLDDILEIIKRGGDVEMLLNHKEDGLHVAAIVGIARTDDGKYWITTADDADPSQEEAEDLIPQTFLYDPATKKISHHSWWSDASILSFVGETRVPEPATWAMMIVGFGAVGLTLRRRRTLAMAPSA